MKPDKKEKRDLQIKTLKRTLRYLRGYRLQLVGALASATVATFATLYAPRVIGRAVDRMVGPGEVDFIGLRADCLALATCAFVAGVAQFVMTSLNNRVAFGVARDIRVDAFRRLQKLPLGYLDGKPYGETSSRIVTDADLFSDGLLTGFSQFFTGIVAIVGVLCFMASLSLPITCVVVALTPLSLVAAWFISKKSFVYFHRQSSLRGEETGYVMEATSGARTLQAFDRGDASSREFEEIDERLTRVSLLAVFFSSLTNPCTRFVNSVVYAGVALTGGLAYEGLANAAASGEPMVIILNDNNMSISENVGGMSRLLQMMRMRPGYISFKKWYRAAVKKMPIIYTATHKLKEWLKSWMLPDNIFSEMGLNYLGPIDGHDLATLEKAIRLARDMECPVLLHVLTRKGKGCDYAESHPDKYHGVGCFDAKTGVVAPVECSFSDKMGESLCRYAEEDSRIVAITAAMAGGTGTECFAAKFPSRFFDTGIAEGHARFRTAA